jgi:hypothetical protein
MKTYRNHKEIPLLDRDFDAHEDLGFRIQAARRTYTESKSTAFTF